MQDKLLPLFVFQYNMLTTFILKTNLSTFSLMFWIFRSIYFILLQFKASWQLSTMSLLYHFPPAWWNGQENWVKKVKSHGEFTVTPQREETAVTAIQMK